MLKRIDGLVVAQDYKEAFVALAELLSAISPRKSEIAQFAMRYQAIQSAIPRQQVVRYAEFLRNALASVRVSPQVRTSALKVMRRELPIPDGPAIEQLRERMLVASQSDASFNEFVALQHELEDVSADQLIKTLNESILLRPRDHKTYRVDLQVASVYEKARAFSSAHKLLRELLELKVDLVAVRTFFRICRLTNDYGPADAFLAKHPEILSDSNFNILYELVYYYDAIGDGRSLQAKLRELQRNFSTNLPVLRTVRNFYVSFGMPDEASRVEKVISDVYQQSRPKNADVGKFLLAEAESSADVASRVQSLYSQLEHTKHAMLLPGDDLVAHPRRPFHSGALTFVVGHEIEHAFNRAETLRAERAFSEDLRRVSQSSSPIHDYTPVLAQYLDAVRRDEALGQIAGWNAVHSKLEATGDPVTVEAIGKVHHRMRDFVPFPVGGGPAAVHPDIVLNTDITMSPTPGNIEAMGKHYFDRPPRDHMPPGGKEGAMGLNYDHVSNYPNHYGKNAIERILAAEEGAPLFHGRRPEVTFDMAKLGLYEDVLERQGLDLTKSYGNGLYFDSSQLPSAPRRFDHTVEGKNEHKYMPIAPDPVPLPTQLNHPAHPDHEFFQQIRAHVVELDKSLGRGPDHHTDNISSSLAVQARTDGIKRVDRIELSQRGDKLSAIQEVRGEPGQFFDLTSHVPTAEANTPMVQSAAKWPEAMLQFEVHEKIRMESQQRGADREANVSVGFSQSTAESERRTHPIHDPRNPDNRHHALYKELERRLPESSEARMMQFTAACHRHRIKANDLSGVHMDYDSMTLTLDSVGLMATPAQVDMSLPPPEPEQSFQQMRQFDQWMEQMQQQSQQHAQAIQQGPAMGGG